MACQMKQFAEILMIFKMIVDILHLLLQKSGITGDANYHMLFQLLAISIFSS